MKPLEVTNRARAGTGSDLITPARITVFAIAPTMLFLGVVASGWLLASIRSIPTGALAVIFMTLAAIPLLATRLKLATGTFFVWLVVEDLVRKFAGNDIRVYFVKDLLFVTVLISLIVASKGTFPWKAATGSTRFSLYAMVAWAVIMSIPTGLEDWRLPLVGLRLDFMYLPLTAVGFALVRREFDLTLWLGRIAVLAGVASAVGLIQSVIGPDFLSPQQPTPGLIHLVLVRGSETAPVYRPTGTFVGPGRFLTLANIGVMAGLGSLILKRTRLLSWPAAGAAISAAAVWVSGGRAGFLLAVAMLFVAAIAPSIAANRLGSVRSVFASGSLVIAVAFVGFFQPQLLSTRSNWYQETLDPRSMESEWAFRIEGAKSNFSRGVSLGGLVGQGTGTESLGKQYIYGGPEQSPFGLYQIEGGYAAVVVEWGVIGLLLWLLWTSAWVRRLWLSIKESRGSAIAPASLILFAWIFFFLFIGFVGGMQGYQNYLANAYFWLFSGVIFALPRITAADSEIPPE